MPYASRPANALPMTMPPPSSMKMSTVAKKKAASLKSSGKKLPIKAKKQRPSSGAKTNSAAKIINNGNSSSSITPAAKVAPPLSSFSALASVPSSTTSATQSKMSDTEFAKYVASEFKRRGYLAAIQLKPFSPETAMDTSKGPAKKKRKGMQKNDGNEEVNKDGDEVRMTPKTNLVGTTSPVSTSAETTTAATTANDDSTQTIKKCSKESLTSARKSKLLPSPSLSLPSFSFYPSISTPNSKQAATWEAMYDQLRDYVQKHDGKLPLSPTTMTSTMEETTANSTAMAATTTPPEQQGATANDTKIPASTTTTTTTTTTNEIDAETKKNYQSLCNWTKKQLSSWNRMKTDCGHNLSLERISKLHALDFEVHYAKFAAVSLSSSSSMVAATSGVPTASAAASAAAAAVSSVIEVDPDKSAINAQKWQEKFESLKRYKEMYGDTNVSRKNDVVLSRWCATQRVRCNLTSDKGGAAAAGEVTLNDSKKNPLTREQFQLLEGIGFATSAKRKKYDRSVIDKKWEEKFQELVRFKEEHGHCDVGVRKGFEDHKKLATWAGSQRQKYKARLSGTKSGRTTDITDEQIMKLGSLGFTFTLQDDFETRFNQLVQFKKEFGHTKVPVFYTGYNNLGRWAKRMRDGIRNSEPWMDDVRKTRLLGIDFDIAARRVFDHAPKKTDDMQQDELAAAPNNAQLNNSEFDFYYYHGYHQGSL